MEGNYSLQYLTPIAKEEEGREHEDAAPAVSAGGDEADSHSVGEVDEATVDKEVSLSSVFMAFWGACAITGAAIFFLIRRDRSDPGAP